MLDVVLQLPHQSQAHRVVTFFEQRGVLALFPATGFAESAVEVGPLLSPHRGPCLVLLRHVDRTPAEFMEWFTASSLERHCTRYYCFDADAPSYGSREEALAALLAGSPPAGPCRLHCCPRDTDIWLAERLPTSFLLEPRRFEHVLSLVQLDGCWRLSVLPAGVLYAHGRHVPEQSRASASTAVNKIHEVCSQVLGMPLAHVGVAIDLGAAPGGWTGYLAGRMQRVIAVDPADLDPAVLALPNVTHLRMKSENAGIAILRSAEGLQQLPSTHRHVAGPAEQLPGLPHDASLPPGSQRKAPRQFPPKPEAAMLAPLVCSAAIADLLVCDMNTHPQQCTAAIVPLLPCLKSGAWIICTMKFFGRGRTRSEAITRFQADLGGPSVVTDCCTVWLLANTVHERTFIVRKM